MDASPLADDKRLLQTMRAAGISQRDVGQIWSGDDDPVELARELHARWVSAPTASRAEWLSNFPDVIATQFAFPSDVLAELAARRLAANPALSGLRRLGARSAIRPVYCSREGSAVVLDVAQRQGTQLHMAFLDAGTASPADALRAARRLRTKHPGANLDSVVALLNPETDADLVDRLLIGTAVAARNGQTIAVTSDPALTPSVEAAVQSMKESSGYWPLVGPFGGVFYSEALSHPTTHDQSSAMRVARGVMAAAAERLGRSARGTTSGDGRRRGR